MAAGLAWSLPAAAFAADSLEPSATASADAAPEFSPPGFGEMSPERRALAIEYSGKRNRLFFLRTGYAWAVWILFLATGWSARLGAWAERRVPRRFPAWALYFVVLTGLLLLLHLPFEYYSGYHLEHRYGHSNQPLGDWMGELLKSEAVGFVVGGLLIYFVYIAIRRKGSRWWLWVGGFTAPVAAFIVVLAPLVISPLFNTFSPLSDLSLRERILDMASQAGIPDSRVFEVDASRQSNKYNAYVTGLFGSKRIVLYDTLLKDMKEDEVLFVMAHEIGHYVMHHLWIGVAGVTCFVFLAAWLVHRLGGILLARFGARWRLSSLSQFGSYPLLALWVSIFGFLSMPVSNAASRYFEHRADAYGLELTGDRNAAARAFEKLAARNLSNPDPSLLVEIWLYDHPTIKDRVTYVLGDSHAAP